MLNKLSGFIRCHELVQPGERVICAVSGGADSVALLFALYLLRDMLGFELAAAHFNHHLRGEESDRDQEFVRELCDRYEIPLYLGGEDVKPGKKGLEAAARDARYGFLESLPGKIATAHTADDNAETVLMHMIRGTGLRGLGGIAPVRGKLIRPMLTVTREEILAFLEEYHLSYVTDSSNETDQFLRNRIRHRVMPLLVEENASLVENLSAMALRLREDEKVLDGMAQPTEDVNLLRQMPQSLRNRALDGYLKSRGVPEPEAAHIALANSLVMSEQPSAKVTLPGGVTLRRSYDKLSTQEVLPPLDTVELPCPGELVVPGAGIKILCRPATQGQDSPDCFTVKPKGKIVVRCREASDQMQLPGGTKSLKKLFIDRKIPAAERMRIPVLADDDGVLAVYGIGPNRLRLCDSTPATEIKFIPL